jgi:hypothetical protein
MKGLKSGRIDTIIVSTLNQNELTKKKFSLQKSSAIQSYFKKEASLSLPEYKAVEKIIIIKHIKQLQGLEGNNSRLLQVLLNLINVADRLQYLDVKDKQDFDYYRLVSDYCQKFNDLIKSSESSEYRMEPLNSISFANQLLALTTQRNRVPEQLRARYKQLLNYKFTGANNVNQYYRFTKTMQDLFAEIKTTIASTSITNQEKLTELTQENNEINQLFYQNNYSFAEIQQRLKLQNSLLLVGVTDIPTLTDEEFNSTVAAEIRRIFASDNNQTKEYLAKHIPEFLIRNDVIDYDISETLLTHFDEHSKDKPEITNIQEEIVISIFNFLNEPEISPSEPRAKALTSDSQPKMREGEKFNLINKFLQVNLNAQQKESLSKLLLIQLTNTKVLTAEIYSLLLNKREQFGTQENAIVQLVINFVKQQPTHLHLNQKSNKLHSELIEIALEDKRNIFSLEIYSLIKDKKITNQNYIMKFLNHIDQSPTTFPIPTAEFSKVFAEVSSSAWNRVEQEAQYQSGENKVAGYNTLEKMPQATAKKTLLLESNTQKLESIEKVEDAALISHTLTILEDPNEAKNLIIDQSPGIDDKGKEKLLNEAHEEEQAKVIYELAKANIRIDGENENADLLKELKSIGGFNLNNNLDKLINSVGMEKSPNKADDLEVIEAEIVEQKSVATAINQEPEDLYDNPPVLIAGLREKSNIDGYLQFFVGYLAQILTAKLEKNSTISFDQVSGKAKFKLYFKTNPLLTAIFSADDADQIWTKYARSRVVTLEAPTDTKKRWIAKYLAYYDKPKENYTPEELKELKELNQAMNTIALQLDKPTQPSKKPVRRIVQIEEAPTN